MISTALFDWDGTLKRDFTILPWVDFLIRNGVLAKDCLKRFEQFFADYCDGSLNHDALAANCAKLYAEQLKGLSCSEIERYAESFFEIDKKELFLWAKDLLCFLDRNKVSVMVISGAPIEALACYKRTLPISEIYAASPESARGVYTGNLVRNPGTSLGKQAAINQLKQLGVRHVLIGAGNSESDRPLFEAAELSLIVDNPNMKLDRKCLYISQDTPIDYLLNQIDVNLNKHEPT